MKTAEEKEGVSKGKLNNILLTICHIDAPSIQRLASSIDGFSFA